MPSRNDGLCCACHLRPATATRSYCQPCAVEQDRAYRLRRPRRKPERQGRPRPVRATCTPALGLLVRADCLPPVRGPVERVDAHRRLAWVAGVPFGWGELKDVSR